MQKQEIFYWRVTRALLCVKNIKVPFEIGHPHLHIKPSLYVCREVQGSQIFKQNWIISICARVIVILPIWVSSAQGDGAGWWGVSRVISYSLYVCRKVQGSQIFKQNWIISIRSRVIVILPIWVSSAQGVGQVGGGCPGWSAIVYMSSGMFRGKESSNRIELSRLVQDLLNFGVLGSLQLWGGGRWVGGHLGTWGVSPHTCTCMCMHAHGHTHIYTCIEIANGRRHGGIHV